MIRAGRSPVHCGRHQRWTTPVRHVPLERRSPRGGNGRGCSVDGGGVKARGSCAGLDEVAEDSVDLLGVCNDGEEVHGRAAPCADHGIDLVHLCEQASPGSSGLPGGHRLIRVVLMRLANVQNGLWFVLLLPSLGGQADQVGFAWPRAATSGGIHSVAAGSRCLQRKQLPPPGSTSSQDQEGVAEPRPGTRSWRRA